MIALWNDAVAMDSLCNGNVWSHKRRLQLLCRVKSNYPSTPLGAITFHCFSQQFSKLPSWSFDFGKKFEIDVKN